MDGVFALLEVEGDGGALLPHADGVGNIGLHGGGGIATDEEFLAVLYGDDAGAEAVFSGIGDIDDVFGFVTAEGVDLHAAAEAFHGSAFAAGFGVSDGRDGEDTVCRGDLGIVSRDSGGDDFLFTLIGLAEFLTEWSEGSGGGGEDAGLVEGYIAPEATGDFAALVVGRLTEDATDPLGAGDFAVVIGVSARLGFENELGAAERYFFFIPPTGMEAGT